MISSAAGSPKSRGVKSLEGRMARIRKYVERHSYSVRPLEARLSEAQRKKYENLKVELAALRSKIEAFLKEGSLESLSKG